MQCHITFGKMSHQSEAMSHEEVDKAWRDAIAIAAGGLSFVENFYKDE